MSTKIVVDYRNPAQRRYIYQPYWISSLELDHADIPNDETKIGIMFSFPAAKYGAITAPIISVLQVCCQITEVWAGGTITVNVGEHTLLTDAVTDGGVATLVDFDQYIASTTITNGTVGAYFAAAASSDWLTSRLLWTEAAAACVLPLDAVVPAVGVDITTDSTTTAGKLRVHMLICEVPLV
jgi:hypothetical protein